ncbi:hypothetical protein [Leptospira sp. mild_001]|uniref:hypothetical protein n=1 Tax=Leptospira sp. mild_001 TaxID=2838238 RepID=UPI001E5CD734|nr:hypothetical protein [Leptospira sp. mild_001]
MNRVGNSTQRTLSDMPVANQGGVIASVGEEIFIISGTTTKRNIFYSILSKCITIDSGFILH